MIKLLRAWNIFGSAIFKLYKFSRASAYRLAKIVRRFYRFAVLWLDFDFLTMYIFLNHLTKTAISFYWFYVLSLTETCYKVCIGSGFGNGL